MSLFVDLGLNSLRLVGSVCNTETLHKAHDKEFRQLWVIASDLVVAVQLQHRLYSYH